LELRWRIAALAVLLFRLNWATVLSFLRRHAQLEQDGLAAHGKILLSRPYVHMVDIREHLWLLE